MMLKQQAYILSLETHLNFFLHVLKQTTYENKNVDNDICQLSMEIISLEFNDDLKFQTKAIYLIKINKYFSGSYY